MVCPRESHHFEGEGFFVEVRTSPNVTGRSIYPRGSASILGTTPWNGAIDGLSADRGMPISSSVDA
jgi:hypothetical protein